MIYAINIQFRLVRVGFNSSAHLTLKKEDCYETKSKVYRGWDDFTGLSSWFRNGYGRKFICGGQGDQVARPVPLAGCQHRIKERTNGRLILEPFAAGSLVPAKEIFNAVKRGMIQMGTISPAYVRDQIEVAGIAAGLPYAFKNVWEAAYYHKWLGFEKIIQAEAAEHGVFYSTDKVYPTELASYLPGPEVYPSLASGVVDGAHWGAAQGAYSMKLYDVCKYHLLPGLNIAGTDAWVVNQKAIDKLPEDIQAIFYNALEEQFWKRTNQYIYLEAIVLAKAVKEKGVEVITLPAEDQKKMTEIAMKMWDKEGEKGPDAAKALKILKDFLKSLGHL
ncbi:MAG: twin-arginine translocation pathway signal protein [Deltaproteobacteria bacterium]|nr:twin-arginine translocation pathway signal protein [Deltaproteobacteria bacterium]